MTVTNIAQGELFTVRIYKRYGSLFWANNYEVRASQDAPFAQTAISDLVDRIVALERQLHIPQVAFDRAVVSTYVRDSVPYNPEAFTTIAISGQGTNDLGQGEPVSLEHCLFVRRVTQAGRPGKLLYRGCLTEGGVTTIDLRAHITPGFVTTLQGRLNSWFAAFLQQPLWRLVLASGDEQLNVREVQGLVLSPKITLKQVGNAYFDRAP
jgi:hypothetical protein